MDPGRTFAATASAPASRTTSRADGGQPRTVDFAALPERSAISHPAENQGAHPAPPAPTNPNGLGSLSAPASAHPSPVLSPADEHGLEVPPQPLLFASDAGLGSPIARASTLDESGLAKSRAMPDMIFEQPTASAPTSIHPASADAQIDYSGSRAASRARRRDHHHHGSGAATPYGGFDAYNAGAWSRPFPHQQSHHRAPLYSLARPLPTHEQRTAQKQYRDAVRQRAGKHHTQSFRHSSHTPSRTTTPHSVIVGPGAIHHGGVPGGQLPFGASTPYGGPMYPPYRHDPEREQMMHMLRQLLDKTQTRSDGTLQDDDDIREDNGLPAGKEGDDKKRRTARAERRDSLASSSTESSEASGEDVELFPNPWARFRHSLRECFAEFLGTFILIFFGTGVSLQVFLSSSTAVVSSPRGQYLSISFGWGIGTALGVWTAGGISGGHINPAITLALATFRGFPWRKVPFYWFSQVLGSMTAAGINYCLYRHAISLYEGASGLRTVTGATATASLFSTYPLDYVSNANAFFQEFVDTAILAIVVLAISDSNNASPPDGLNPLVLFLLITGIGAAQGMQTAYCINPARDLGPRLITWMAGYSREVWNFRSQYWLWTPILATMAGALFGSLVYDALIYTGAESPLNKKWSLPFSRSRKQEFAPASKEKMPAGQSEA